MPTTSNDPGTALRALVRALPPAALAALLCAATGLSAAGCGGRDQASLRRDVRLDASHDPPGSIPAGQPFILGLRVTAEPPLAPASTHLWYLAEGGWERLPLEPLAGTERYEARVPAQPKGRAVRYAFTVRTPLGGVLRIPAAAGDVTADGGAGPASDGTDTSAASPPDTSTGGDATYELVARAPVAPWAAWLRGMGAVAGAALAASGGVLAFRRRTAEGGGRPGAFAKLAAAGVLLFAATALTGAAAASLQATGSPFRDVPGVWWVALAVWIPVLLLARRRRPAGDPLRGGAAWSLLLSAVAGAVLALAGLVAAA